MAFWDRLPRSKLLDDRWPFIFLALILSVAIIMTSGLLDVEHDNEYTIVKGKVLKADDSALSPEPYINGMYIGKQPVTIELLQGKYKGKVFEFTNAMSRGFNIYCRENMTILCNVREENGIIAGIDVFGYSRGGMIYGLIGLFGLILVVIGRKKGFYSMLALLFTLIAVIFFMIPRILEGHDPILMAMATAAITTAVTIFIISGPNTKSCAAIAGIVLGVASAGVIAYIAGVVGNVSGIHMSEAQEVIYLAQELRIKVPELLFAGVIISALGAVMDIGMSISSAIFELKSANHKMTARELYKSGMNIGRDVMGTMSNTLILAFAGSSIMVLLIIVLYKLPYIRMINLDLMAIEFIQGISGSIGLILTVPITAACAAFLAAKTNRKSQKARKNRR